MLRNLFLYDKIHSLKSLHVNLSWNSSPLIFYYESKYDPRYVFLRKSLFPKTSHRVHKMTQLPTSDVPNGLADILLNYIYYYYLFFSPPTSQTSSVPYLSALDFEKLMQSTLTVFCVLSSMKKLKKSAAEKWSYYV